jgi:hypothetical protein
MPAGSGAEGGDETFFVERRRKEMGRHHDLSQRWQHTKAATTPLSTAPKPPEYHAELVDVAVRLTEERHYGPALLVAQMACEVAIGRAIVSLLERRGYANASDWADTHYGRFSFLNSSIRALYFSLTAVRVETETFWKEYEAHGRLRNKVAHRGKEVGEANARKSCDVARKVVHQVEEMLGRVLGESEIRPNRGA